MPLPEYLYPNGREAIQDFKLDCQLYHGFTLADYDENEYTIKIETIRFPDFSCNWNRFSNPEDVRYRRNGSDTDGCYSFTVEVSRFNNRATPVHDPIDVDQDQDYPNYSHVEIRALREGEDPEKTIPERTRSLGGSKAIKLKYRKNLANNLLIEIMASNKND